MYVGAEKMGMPVEVVDPQTKPSSKVTRRRSLPKSLK